MDRLRLSSAALAVALTGLVACSGGEPLKPVTVHSEVDESRVAVASPSVASPTPTSKDKPESNKWVTPRPAWLGTRILPLRADGFGEARPTPPLLRNRRFATVDILPRPRKKGFIYTTGPVPDDVLERSTWRPVCPIAVEDLSYLTMTFWGFDHEAHTGEMIVNAQWAEQLAGVFEKLYDARFEIEEMRVITLEEQRAWNHTPTGDTNVTSSFECRRATLNSTWSMHSLGLAIDINPFHNPYIRGDLIAPELAGAYADRSRVRPGMAVEGSPVVQAFDAIGWGWGGRWTSFKDYMHFSSNGH